MLGLGQVESSHLFGGDLDARFVSLFNELGLQAQASLGHGSANVVEDGGEAVERTGRPVLADFAEDAMLDGIPLAAPGGIVDDADGEVVGIAEGVLEVVLPGAWGAAVAAAGVGEDDEFGGVGIARAALVAPPGLDAVDREGRCVGGLANADAAAVGEQVVDAVGDGAAVGFGGEVVVFDVGGAIVPGAAGIAEVADEFFLLGICWAPRYVELML